MKTIMFLGAALLVQQGEKNITCPVTTVEAGFYCEKCQKVRDKEDKCNVCDSPVRKVEVCVRKLFECGCGGGGCCKITAFAPGKCKCGNPTKNRTGPDKAVVQYACPACGASAYAKEEVKHDEEKHKGKKDLTPKRTCTKSGTAPHIK